MNKFGTILGIIGFVFCVFSLINFIILTALIIF